MRPTSASRPRLALGCRLTDAAGPTATLLMPERAMRLNGPALEIIRRCDGTRTLADIAAELQPLFPGAEAAVIEKDAADLLERLQERRAVDFEP
jgi:coenzyme PQQ biosynthesis protein PqqD